MRILMVLFILFPFSSTAFAADLLVTWQDGQGNLMKVAHRDDTHIRMDNQPDNYTLLRGDKIYMATKDEGEWQVVDLDQMSGMAKMFASKAVTSQAKDYKATFAKTGKTEKIASYKGTVYVVEVRDEAKKLVQKEEVVFSRNSDVRRASQAMMTIAAKMGDKMGLAYSANMDEAMQEAANKDYGGTLRYGSDMKVVSIEKGSLPAGYFDLPQNANQLDVGQAPASQSGKKSGFFDQLMGDSESAAKDETRNSTVDEVREGVRGAFKNLFD